jgi:hypothetical protein
MYQVDEWHWKLNICLLIVPKYDVIEIVNAMFLRVESPCEIIFYLLVGP